MHLHMLSCARCSRPCAHTADTSACKDSRRHVTHMVACQVLGYLGGHACRLFASCAYVKRVYVCLLPCTLNCRRCALVGALPLYNTVCGNSIRPDDHLQAGSILTHKHTHNKHRQTLRQAGRHTQTYPCPSCTPCPLPRALPCVSQRLSFLGTHPPAHVTVFGTRSSLVHALTSFTRNGLAGGDGPSGLCWPLPSIGFWPLGMSRAKAVAE